MNNQYMLAIFSS